MKYVCHMVKGENAFAVFHSSCDRFGVSELKVDNLCSSKTMRERRVVSLALFGVRKKPVCVRAYTYVRARAHTHTHTHITSRNCCN